MAMQIYEAEMAYSTPMGPKESKFEDAPPYYSLGLIVDEDAPDARYNEGKDRYEVYITFNEGSDVEEYIKGLSAGDKIRIVYDERGDRSSYKPIIDKKKTSKAKKSKKPRVKPAEVAANGRGTNTVALKSPTGLLNDRGIKAWVASAHQAIEILSELHDAVSNDEVLGALPEATQQKYAVTAFIHGDKNRHGVVLPDEQPASPGAIEIILSADPDDLPMSLLKAIDEASSNVDGVREVAETLKRFGYSRDDMNPDDKEGWINFFAIVDTFHDIKSERGEEAASAAVRSMIGGEKPGEEEDLF